CCPRERWVSAVGDTFEEVGALARGLRRNRGGECVALFGTVFFEHGNGDLHEWRLGLVLGEGFLLFVDDGADVERVSPWCGQRRAAVREEEVAGEVVEALRLPEIADGDVALGRAGPVEGRGGGGRD